MKDLTETPEPAATAVAESLPATPLVSVQDLQVHFHSKRGVVHAVDGVSLDISDGETVGLVGETGSGKSVTGRSLLRLVPDPPGFYAGGRLLFRPKQSCSFCSGAGCADCDWSGKVDTSCPSCAGLGCEACSESGRRTIDLLQQSEREMRRIRGNHIAMVFQDPGKALNPTLTVRTQLAEIFAEHRSLELLTDAGIDPHRRPLLRREAHGRSSYLERRLAPLPPWRSGHRRLQAVIDEHVARALADVRIPNPRQVMDRYPHELSGGMKQRVMIAQALACDPELLIADEPTTALDVTIQARILDLLAEVQERKQMAVLYISHDLSIVRHISDRVAVMYAGQLVEVGETSQIFDDPLHPYTRGLLAAIPSGEQRRGELLAIEGSVPELINPGAACRFAGRCPNAAPACRTHDVWLAAQNAEDHEVACLLYESPTNVGVPAAEMPSKGPMQ